MARKTQPKRKRVEKRKRAQLPPAPPPDPTSPREVAEQLVADALPEDADGLSPKHRRFVIEYLVDQNGKAAAIRAGYSPVSAESTASVILSDPKVRATVDAALEQRAKEAGASVEEVVTILTRVAKADLRRVVDEHGRVLPLQEIPEDLAAAISSIEVEELFGTQEAIGPRGGVRKERVQIGYTTKVKLWDKNKAAELLGKWLRMWKEQLEHSGPGGGPMQTAMSPEEVEKVDGLLARVERLLDGSGAGAPG